MISVGKKQHNVKPFTIKILKCGVLEIVIDLSLTFRRDAKQLMLFRFSEKTPSIIGGQSKIITLGMQVINKDEGVRLMMIKRKQLIVKVGE